MSLTVWDKPGNMPYFSVLNINIYHTPEISKGSYPQTQIYVGFFFGKFMIRITAKHF